MEKSTPTYTYAVLGIVFLSLLFRLVAAFYWQDQTERTGRLFRFGDSHSYWVLATAIGRGEPYQYGSENSKIFRAPLYPIVLAPLTWLQGAHEQPTRFAILSARIFGCIAGALCVWCIIATARKLGGDTASLIAGGFACCYPGAIGMSIFILSESIFCPLIVTSIAILVHGLRLETPLTSRKSPFVWSGILAGLACLARPSFFLWAVALAIYFFVAMVRFRTFGKGNPRYTMLSLFASWSLFLMAFMLVMLPWWIRNYCVTGKFVATTLQVGASLYDGMHAGASGSSDENMEFVVPFWEEQASEDARTRLAGIPLESTYEWRLDQRMRNAAIAWCWENPSDVIRLALIKLQKTFRPFPVAAEVGSGWIRVAEGVAYLLIFVSGIWGAWELRNEIGCWLFVLPLLYFGVIHMIFIGSVRYRQPAVLILCVLAGIGLYRCSERIGFARLHSKK